jgi:hypothetical protein
MMTIDMNELVTVTGGTAQELRHFATVRQDGLPEGAVCRVNELAGGIAQLQCNQDVTFKAGQNLTLRRAAPGTQAH